MRRVPSILAKAALALLLVALFAPLSVAGAAPVGAAGSQRRIVDLGTLGGPQNQSEATAINARGEVVGWSTLDGGEAVTHAFRWRRGRMVDLAPLTAANAINDHGVIAGAGVTATGEYHAFRWARGKATDLGTLGGDFSQALGINNRGQIVGLSTTAAGEPHAFLWARGRMTDLALPVTANDINERGQIVGSYRPPGEDEPHAYLYRLRQRRLTDLGTIYGLFSEATAVNNRGQVVGYVGVRDRLGPNSAFRWSKGHMIDLETSLESTGSEYSQALGINDRGTVVGVIGVPSVGPRGFVWRHGVMTMLGVLTEGGSYGGIANDINHRGVIVGSSGVGPDTYHAVLWR
jgi:probable HAF family extracellular repeat protein